MYSPIRTIIKNRTNEKRVYHIANMRAFILSPKGTAEDTYVMEGDVFSGASDRGPRAAEPLIYDMCDKLIDIKFEIEFPFSFESVHFPIMSSTQNCRRILDNFVACGGYKPETKNNLVEDNLPVDSEPAVGGDSAEKSEKEESKLEETVLKQEIESEVEKEVSIEDQKLPEATEEAPVKQEEDKVEVKQEEPKQQEEQKVSEAKPDTEVTLPEAASEPVEKKQTKKSTKKATQKIKVD